MPVDIEVSRLVSHRHPLTVKYKTPGIPITQTVHYNIIDRYLKTGEIPGSNSTAYSCYVNDSTGGFKDLREFARLVDQIKNQGFIRDCAPTAWILHNKVECHDGNHRAAIATALGFKTMPILPEPLDPVETVGHEAIEELQRVYIEAAKHESLREGQTYNPVPGMENIRNGLDRLKLIWEEIMTVPGTKLLDLGANDGYFAGVFSKHTWDVVCVERQPAYVDIIKKRMEIIGSNAIVFHETVEKFVSSVAYESFDVVLYLDVFQHRVRESTLEIAVSELTRIINISKHKLILSMGWPGKLPSTGFTEYDLQMLVLSLGKSLRCLGRDNDGGGYGREIYCIE